MNPEDLEGLLQELMQAITQVTQSGETLSDEFQGMLAQTLSILVERIDQESAQASNEPLSENPPINDNRQTGLGAPPSPSAQLMWILAGQREDVFLQYIQQYPDPELRQLSGNPGELERTIQYLHQMMPSAQPEVSQEGIPHAELNSSNIYGFQYDPSSKSLKVKFQGNGGSGEGPVYEYDKVPPNVYKAFEMGAVPAKTSGQNQWGSFWVGKNPSLGAAFHSLIRQGGYQYRKL